MGVDPLLEELTTYLVNPPVFRPEALQAARLCLADALACA